MNLPLAQHLLFLLACLASPTVLFAHHHRHAFSAINKASSDDELQQYSSSVFPPAIFVFGASMVDAGTNSFTKPRVWVTDYDPYGSDYFGKPVGKWSNGRTFLDIITQSLGFGFLDPFTRSVGSNFSHGVNFAVASSTAQNLSKVANLLVQVDQFQLYQSLVLSQEQGTRAKSKAQQVYSDAIYFMETAHNDYITAGVDCDHEETVQLVMASMRQALERLYELGARNMIVMNVTPLGCTPMLLSSADDDVSSSARDDDGCLAAWNQLVLLHNQNLQVLLDDLRSSYASAEWILFDAYTIFMDGYRNPSNYGIEYPFQACCGAGGSYNFNDAVHCGRDPQYINGTYIAMTKCENASLYLIWDSLHPTESFSKYVADGVLYGSHLTPSFNITEKINFVRLSIESGYQKSRK